MKWADIKPMIAKAAPVVGTLIGGPAGIAVGGLVAAALGVDSTPEAVAHAIRTDPDAAIKLAQLQSDERVTLQKIAASLVVAELKADAETLATVNATMQAEYGSSDKFVSRWRPTMGYAVTLSWVMMWGAVCWVIIMEPGQAAAVITALAATAIMWGVALSVLGVAVYKRTQDKAMAMGVPPPDDVFSAITQRIAGKKS